MARRSPMAIGVAGSALLLVLCGCGSEGGTAQLAPSASAAAPPTNPGSSFVTASAVQAAQQVDTPVSAAIVIDDNAFGLELLNLLGQSQGPGASANLAISPTSIALALQMLYNGAASSTEQAMAQALQLQTLTAPQVDADNAALQAALISPDPDVELTINNSLWMHLADNPVQPSFTQTNEAYYGAAVGDLSGSPADINAWAATSTAGLITQILPADFNPADAILVIANTIYFKGAWSTPFDPAQTTAALFTRSDGTQVSAEMMHQSGTSYGYLQTNRLQMLRLPYGQKNRLSMIIVLPQAGVTLNSLVAGLTMTQLSSWIAQLAPTQVTLALPRFASSYSAPLKAPLTSLGMGIAFSPEADFSSLASGAYVSFVQHATIVEVDETGTVAAGGTSVGVVTTVAMPSATMTVDHPFLYVVRDDGTGALLFIGLMFDPTSH